MEKETGTREAAEKNRSRCPEIAALVDAFRREFGPGVTVIWAKEGDVELGRKPDDRAPLNKS